MRRIVAVAVSAVTLTGGLALGTPAQAATNSALVKTTAVKTETLSGKAFLAQAKSEGKAYSAKEAAAIAKATSCRSLQRTEAYTRGSSSRWVFFVRTKLNWCWNGTQVVGSYGATDTYYTSNKTVYKWRGWANKSLTHGPTYLSVTTYVRGRFVYGSRTYKPYVKIQGFYNGAANQWWG